MSLQFFLRALCFGVGLYAFVFGVISIIKGRASKRWPQVPGKVVRSSVKVHKDSDGKSYWPTIEYAYVFEGITYVGTQFSHGEMSHSSQHGADAALSSYPPNASIIVFVNPRKPSDAVLTSGTTSASIMVVAIGLFFVILTLLPNFLPES